MKPIPVEYQNASYDLMLDGDDARILRYRAAQLREIGRRSADNHSARIYASRMKQRAQRIERGAK